ncbi:hypothetical protein [Amycolatopsis granulosa]|uniref:hypothetical protein n=1 Tax=Amycolatopsis granulosa TaxID=185684 RepID=UPI00141FE459|nr:hypothetical protein [Amycolatopsis granulosa]NIH83728.1 hypothetical protein [Amycolatopsis granulosa]
MLHTPYMRFAGDADHERVLVITPVWVRLDAIYVRVPGAPAHTVVTGLDMTGDVPGRLTGWFSTPKGDWPGVVDFEIP